MLIMHCDKEPVYQKHPVQAGTDRKIRKTSKKIQDQFQESQSSDSDKKDNNFSPKQLRFLEVVGSKKKNKPYNRSDNQSNNLMKDR